MMFNSRLLRYIKQTKKFDETIQSSAQLQNLEKIELIVLFKNLLFLISTNVYNLIFLRIFLLAKIPLQDCFSTCVVTHGMLQGTS